MGNTVQKLPHIPPPDLQHHLIEPQQQSESESEFESNLQQHHIESQQQSESEPEFSEFTCQICIEPTDKKFRNNGKCSHPYCTDCIIKYIRVQLDDNNVGDIKCPAPNCDHTLDAAACAAVVGPTVFVRWCDVLCESAILGFERCYCPYSNCNVLILDECGEKLRKSKCPNCERWFCFECGRVWHAGFGCEENGEERDGNDVAFGALVEEKNWKRCPRCRHFVEKVEGCPDVKCRCKMIFCYTCGRQKCTCENNSELGWRFIAGVVTGFIIFLCIAWMMHNVLLFFFGK